MENMFYFFYKIIIFHFLNKEIDDIQSVKVYFNFFHEPVTCHNLETAHHIGHVIFVLHSTMKIHCLVDQSKRTYYPNYFIILLENYKKI